MMTCSSSRCSLCFRKEAGTAKNDAVEPFSMTSPCDATWTATRPCAGARTTQASAGDAREDEVQECDHCRGTRGRGLAATIESVASLERSKCVMRASARTPCGSA
jgi:hypothetical protein